MRVKEIVIDGFKSYAKRTVITSWDPQFNCITGLNGSGKSNILDAICFVLGITTMSTVRAQNQQDLIYKRGQAGVTKASVSIVFDNSDKAKSPMDYRNVDTITVTRQVVLGGTSKYLINGHRAQQTQVQQLFQEVQLNVNNPNFLIMQGQITKVVNMRPTEILELIEEAAGTGMYEKERLKAVKEIRNRDIPLHETESLLNEEVRPKLEKLRSQKRQFLEYQQCASSTETLEKVLAASEYNFYRQKLAKLEKEAEERTIRTESLKAQLDVDTAKHAELERQLVELKSQQQTQESNRLDAELQAANEEHACVVAELEDKQQQLAVLERQLHDNQGNIEALNQKLIEHEQSVEAFEREHASLKEKYDKQHEYVEERRELLTGLQTGISTTGEKETGYAYTTKRCRESLANAKQYAASLAAERDQLEKEADNASAADTERRIDEEKAKLIEISRTEESKKAELARLSETAKLAKELRVEHQELKDEAAGTERELERILSRYPNLSSPGDNPLINGRVAQLFTIAEKDLGKSLALEVCAGAGIWSLVVANEKVGAEVLKHARKRMTVLPLNRIRSQVISRKTVEQIDADGAWLALDLLSFDEQVRPAIEYVFGRTVVCATSTIAERAAFQFGIRSVTLEGDVFDPRGVISGGFQGVRGHGSQQGGTSTVLSAVAQYEKLMEKQTATLDRIKSIDDKLSEVGHAALATEQLSNELSLVSHELQLTKVRLAELDTSFNNVATLRSKLDELITSKIPKAEESISLADAALQKALKESAEFNINREAKLAELQTEVDNAVALQNKLAGQLELQSAQHSQNQAELARLRADLSQEKSEETMITKTLDELRISVDNTLSDTLPKLNAKITELNEKLKTENSRISAARQDMQEIESELTDLHSRIAETRLELQQDNHLLENQGDALTQARNSYNKTLKRWSWAPDAASSLQNNSQSLSQTPQSLQALEFTFQTIEDPAMLQQLEALRHNFTQEQRRLQSLASRVDSSVVTMIERLENDETQLRQRLVTIREDRRKLEESMETLNQRRRETIDNVWKQVSRDFGLIFGDLLPNSTCKLVPLSDQPIENGFAIRVRLGATWKDGLTELSGGQRSLVALSLILALLRYHPAPVYILDEVDAALDVHHTRNIGHIIKTRFQNAQFIVVSLKDDMFTNANRIYQTRFIDGTSTVAIMA